MFYFYSVRRTRKSLCIVYTMSISCVFNAVIRPTTPSPTPSRRFNLLVLHEHLRRLASAADDWTHLDAGRAHCWLTNAAVVPQVSTTPCLPVEYDNDAPGDAADCRQSLSTVTCVSAICHPVTEWRRCCYGCNVASVAL